MIPSLCPVIPEDTVLRVTMDVPGMAVSVVTTENVALPDESVVKFETADTYPVESRTTDTG